MKNTFFISDTHFWHANVIKFNRRPWETVEDMNEGLIHNWNSVVNKGDDIYHLGDIVLANKEKTEGILRRLNGNIHFIRGNHDKSALQFKKYFAWIKDLYDFTTPDGDTIVLCHYPLERWNKSHYGSYHLHGHCHESLMKVDPDIRRLNMGVDNPLWNYTPVHLDTILEVFNQFEK